MTYHGRIKNGVITLDNGASLPEGTEVIVQLVDSRPLNELVCLAQSFEDDTDWPANGAEEHDHYLYGVPRHEQ